MMRMRVIYIIIKMMTLKIDENFHMIVYSPPSNLYLPAILQVSFFHFGLQVALEKFPNKLQHFRRVPRPMTPLTMTLPSYPFTSEAQPLLVTISHSSFYFQNKTGIMPQDYVKDLHFSTSEFQRSLRMTVIDFIGNVGGLVSGWNHSRYIYDMHCYLIYELQWKL